MVIGGVLLTEAAGAGEPGADRRLVLDEGWRLESSAKVSVAGGVLSTPRYDASAWHATSVPATVVAALVADGTLPDPHFGSNLRSFPGMSYPVGANLSNLPMPADSPFRVSWWYRREFALPGSLDPRASPTRREDENPLIEKPGQSRRTWLQFGGINSSANVWLNGKRVASAEDTAGAMRTHEFDVTELAAPDETNVLAVEVFPPEPKDLAITFVDWNPLPPDKLMGLYREVSLLTSGPLVVRHPHVMTQLAGEGNPTARLTVIADVRNATSRSVAGVLEGRIAALRFTQNVTLGPEETRTLRFTPQSFPQLVLEEPQLWWPAPLGPQHLHDLELRCVVAGEVSDTAHLRFGIREVTDEITPEGHRLFRVNGKRILIRGAGYTPEMLLRASAKRQADELRYVRDMHLNAVRLEGKLEDDHFLELCDRMGVLVLAGWCCCDHWEKWAEWTDRDRKIAAESQRSQIRRLRGHASMLAWMNASDMPPPADVERIYLDLLKELDWPNPVLSSASATPSDLSGPSGVKMLGPYEYVPPIYWYVDRRRGGAYGFNTETSPGPAIPPIESLRRMLPSDHLWPIDDEWLFHAGGNVFRSLDVFNSALAARYGRCVDVEDYARKAQMMAYETHRAMFEAFGRNKYVSTGVIQWMLDNAWPSLIWHLYDHYLRPGGSYFGAKKGCEPLHAQYSYDDRTVVVVNSYPRALPGMLVTAVVYDADSRERYRRSQRVDVAPDESRVAFQLPEMPDLSPTYVLQLSLAGAEGRSVTTNTYWLSNRPDVLDPEGAKWYYTPVKTHADLTGLARLAEAEMNVEAQLLDSDGRDGRAVVCLKNPSGRLAFGIRLKLTRTTDGEELLPVLWEDNYLVMTPGEQRDLSVRFPRAELSAASLEIEVTAWNAKPLRARLGPAGGSRSADEPQPSWKGTPQS